MQPNRIPGSRIRRLDVCQNIIHILMVRTIRILQRILSLLLSIHLHSGAEIRRVIPREAPQRIPPIQERRRPHRRHLSPRLPGTDRNPRQHLEIRRGASISRQQNINLRPRRRCLRLRPLSIPTVLQLHLPPSSQPARTPKSRQPPPRILSNLGRILRRLRRRFLPPPGFPFKYNSILARRPPSRHPADAAIFPRYR